MLATQCILAWSGAGHLNNWDVSGLQIDLGKEQTKSELDQTEAHYAQLESVQWYPLIATTSWGSHNYNLGFIFMNDNQE